MAAKLTLRLLRMHVGWIALWIPLWDRWLSLDKMLRKYTPRHPIALYQGVASDTIVELVLQRLQRPRMMRRRACYRRGLLLFYFLRLAKFAPILHFGVCPPGTDARRLHAHCWVSLSGVVLAEQAPTIPEFFCYDGVETRQSVKAAAAAIQRGI
jgi:hypothetical protein